MNITTTADQLAEVRFRIDRMQARAQAGVAADGLPRIQRHLEALRQDEAAVRAAAGQTPGEVEAKLGRLESRLDVAEHSLTADLSGDWATFAAAVEEELRSWDIYLERLQTGAAADAWKARSQAETAIADIRSRRIAVEERLVQARDGGHEQRDRVTALRDELAHQAQQLPTKFN